MGWCPVGRVGVVAGTARGSAGEVSSTSLDRSHGNPPPYRGRAVKRHDETRPTANSSRSSSRSSRSTICGHRGEHRIAGSRSGDLLRPRDPNAHQTTHERLSSAPLQDADPCRVDVFGGELVPGGGRLMLEDSLGGAVVTSRDERVLLSRHALTTAICFAHGWRPSSNSLGGDSSPFASG